MIPYPDVKLGDILTDKHGNKAKVIELLPDDKEHFARLLDLSQGYEFSATSENQSEWK